MHILTVDDSASLRKPIMRRIGTRDAIERNSACETRRAIELERALESRTFDLILVNVVEGSLEKSFTPETIQSTIGPS